MNQENYTQELAQQNSMPLASLCLITGEITLFNQDHKILNHTNYQQSVNTKPKK